MSVQLQDHAPLRFESDFGGLMPDLDINDGVKIGDFALDSNPSYNTVWMCVDNAYGASVWTTLDLDVHAGLTGAAVHGLGTASTHDEDDFQASGAVSDDDRSLWTSATAAPSQNAVDGALDNWGIRYADSAGNLVADDQDKIVVADLDVGAYTFDDLVLDALSSDYVGVWKFEAGALTTDSSGNGKTLSTITGSPSESVHGKSGGCALLQAASYKVSNLSFNSTKYTLFGVWIYNQGGDRDLFGFENAGSGRVMGLYRTGTAWVFSSALWNNSFRVFVDPAPSSDAWHHVLVYVDDTDKKLYVYVDGLLAGSNTYTGTPDTFMDFDPGAGTDYRFAIGSMPDGWNCTNTAYRFDEAILIHSSTSQLATDGAADIASRLYSAGSGKFYAESVVRSYKKSSSKLSDFATAAHTHATPDGVESVAVGPSALALNEGDYNTALGHGAAESLVTGSDVVAVGHNALSSLTSGYGNVALGAGAMSSATWGHGCVAAGHRALEENTTGHSNTAVGRLAGSNIVTGYQNAFVGHQAGSGASPGTAYSNAALGHNALLAISSGARNTALGEGALLAAQDGHDNVAVGHGAASSLTSGGSVVAAGVSALAANTADYNVAVGAQAACSTVTSSGIVAVGYQALYSANGADDCVAVGHQALLSITTGGGNTAVGHDAGHHLTTGRDNVAVGVLALSGAITTTASEHTAVGSNTLAYPSGTGHTAVGYFAGRNCRAGGYNTMLGHNAGRGGDNSDSSSNVAVGASALLSHATNGSSNVAVGYRASYSSTTGAHNVCVGFDSAYGNVKGSYIVAVGSKALYSATSSTDNGAVAVGYQAMYSSNGAASCVAVGYRAMCANTTGDYNTVVGFEAMCLGSASEQSVAVGYKALYSGETYSVAVGATALYDSQGSYNTAVGCGALRNLNSNGATNVALGSFAGYYHGSGSDALYDADDSVFIGNFARAGANAGSNEIVIGSQAVGKGSNTMTLGNSSVDVYIAKLAGGGTTGLSIDNDGKIIRTP